MGMRIDDKSVLSLGLVVALLIGTVSISVTGAFWISSVDNRLSRIEEKLGIPSKIEPAKAEGKVYANFRGLPETIRRLYGND